MDLHCNDHYSSGNTARKQKSEKSENQKAEMGIQKLKGFTTSTFPPGILHENEKVKNEKHQKWREYRIKLKESCSQEGGGGLCGEIRPPPAGVTVASNRGGRISLHSQNICKHRGILLFLQTWKRNLFTNEETCSVLRRKLHVTQLSFCSKTPVNTEGFCFFFKPCKLFVFPLW